jgi:hypothetical protein
MLALTFVERKFDLFQLRPLSDPKPSLSKTATILAEVLECQILTTVVYRQLELNIFTLGIAPLDRLLYSCWKFVPVHVLEECHADWVLLFKIWEGFSTYTGKIVKMWMQTLRKLNSKQTEQAKKVWIG